MSRKKIFVLMSLVAAIGMTGCSSQKDSGASTVSSTETEENTAAATDHVSSIEADTESVSEEADSGADTNNDIKNDSTDEDTAANKDMEEDASEDSAKDINVYEDTDDAISSDDDMEDETEASLEPITPSSYLIDNITNYVTLGSLDGLSVTQYTYEITDEMVEEQVSYELEMFSDEVETDRASASDDIVYADMVYSINGEESDAESIYFTLGYEEYGAEFDEQLTGVTAGETKSFSITFEDDIWVDEWIDQTVAFEVTVTSVCELVIPEYNDEFVSEYTDYSTVEEYEASVRDLLVSDYEEMSYSDVSEALFKSASSQSVFAGYPDDLYETCKDELLSIYYAFTGATEPEEVYDMFGITEEDLDSEILDSVDRRLLVSAICEAYGLELTEDEYISFVEDYAEYYGYDSAVQFEEDNTREAIVWTLYESKAAEYLYDNAEITEEVYTENLSEEES